MKELWLKHSYDVVKLLINQFAISMFGFALAFATGKSENKTLLVITSIGAIVFYLFLLYASSFDMGLKDQNRVSSGRSEFRPLTGLYVSLLANVPNFILAVLITLGILCDNQVISNIGGVAKVISLLIQGMYTGVLSTNFGGQPLNCCWWIYFLVIVPSLAVCTGAYICGVKGWHLTRILLPETPEEIERKKEAKRKKKEE
ncbi:MAG: hypothetical protein MJ102_03230 [Clostridia bacterium]|nr:hypothetical protein [Clostridia bacterium]